MFPILTFPFGAGLSLEKRLRLALVISILFVTGAVKASVAQGAREAVSLEVGKAIMPDFAGGEQHRYELKLAAGECADIVVEQRGIDVTVELYGTDGKLLIRVDDEYRSQGEEKLEVVAETAGNFRLVVKSSAQNAPAGGYQIRAAEFRAATERDRALYETHKLRPAFDRTLTDGQYDAPT